MCTRVRVFVISFVCACVRECERECSCVRVCVVRTYKRTCVCAFAFVCACIQEYELVYVSACVGESLSARVPVCVCSVFRACVCA